MKLNIVAAFSFLLGIIIAQALHTRQIENRLNNAIDTLRQHEEIVQTWKRLSNTNFGVDQ